RGTRCRAGFIVLGTPFRHALALIEANRTVDDDARRGIAVVDRGGVNQRLERTARLSPRLNGAIELTFAEAEAADNGKDAAGMRIHCHKRASNGRDLLQLPFPLHVVLRILGLARRDEDHITDFDDNTGTARRCTHPALADLWPRPLHGGEGNVAGLALGHELALGIACRSGA